MSRLALLIAVAAVVYILFRRAQGMPPKKQKAEYIKLGLAVAVVIVVGLTLAGKMHWIGAAITAVLVFIRQSLPALIRLFPMLAALKGRTAAGSASQSSTVETEILRMQLDHNTGALDGEVLKDTFQGWQLSAMNADQLRELMGYCKAQCRDSTALLQSYMQQRFGGADNTEQAGHAGTGSSNPSRKEALAILGLEEDATEQDIIAAHRKLMQKMHPDRGGSHYLASKINQAKDTLLS